MLLIFHVLCFADNLTEALLFLSHFMGDIHQVSSPRSEKLSRAWTMSIWVCNASKFPYVLHFILWRWLFFQPMHIGFTSDEGGNTIELHWFRHKSNLHHVRIARLLEFGFWDSSHSLCSYRAMTDQWFSITPGYDTGVGSGDHLDSRERLLWKWHGPPPPRHSRKLHRCKALSSLSSIIWTNLPMRHNPTHNPSAAQVEVAFLSFEQSRKIQLRFLELQVKLVNDRVDYVIVYQANWILMTECEILCSIGVFSGSLVGWYFLLDRLHRSNLVST